MRITSRGQVTIPVAVRESAGLMPHTDVDFVVEGTSVRIVKNEPPVGDRRMLTDMALHLLRGAGTANDTMTTDEIIAMMRGAPP